MLDGNIRDEVMGVNRKSSVDGQFVPIAPGETAALPVESRAVAVREVEASLHGKVRGHSSQHTIFGRVTRSNDAAVSGFENQRS
jgi:hypothetical protein